MGRIHFIGIGGIGMSALARIYLDKGYMISGSDLGENEMIHNLRNDGAIINRGHNISNVPVDCDLVVKSTCIKDSNPEVIFSKNKGIPVILRGELLKRTMGMYLNPFAVTGTHGKTTTTSLLAHIMEKTELDPTVIIGGEVETFSGNAKTGKNDILITEVDESDGYFRNLSARYAAITNIEREHMEHYGSMQELKNAFRQFMDNIPEGGGLVVNGNDPIIKEVVDDRYSNVLRYGISTEFDVHCVKHRSKRNIEFGLSIKGTSCGTIRSSLIGDYNIMNILAAVSLMYISGLYDDNVIKAIETFPGVKRRFERVGMIKGIDVIEDYAHHPTEIRAVIKAASNYSTGRILTVFQPHRYSRTIDLKEEFKNCFAGTDMLVLTDIYSAHEETKEEIALEEVFGEQGRFTDTKINFLRKPEIPQFIAKYARQGDMVLVLGAGDIREISSEILDEIKKNKACV